MSQIKPGLSGLFDNGTREFNSGVVIMRLRAKSLVALFIAVAVTACRIEVLVPGGGAVATESGVLSCEAGSTCSVEVTDSNFREIFIAEPADGAQFIGWKMAPWFLCGGKLTDCVIDTGNFADNPDLMPILDSDNTAYLEPVFIPVDDIRAFQAGDTVKFSGRISLKTGDRPAQSGPVTVSTEYLPSNYAYLNKNLLAVRTTVASSQVSPEQVTVTDMWQEDNGARFDYRDEDGNAYLTAATNQYGLMSIPVPLIPSATAMIDFYTMFGGHTSGPITQGTRSILVGARETVTTPAGDFLAYPVTRKDTYEYLSTYADNKRGTRVVVSSKLWISPAKGAVKVDESLSEYSSSGVLLAQRILELEAVRFNF